MARAPKGVTLGSALGSCLQIKRGLATLEMLLETAEAMKNLGLSSSNATKKYNISCHITLSRFFKALGKGSASVGYNPQTRLLNTEQESRVFAYIH